MLKECTAKTSSLPRFRCEVSSVTTDFLYPFDSYCSRGGRDYGNNPARSADPPGRPNIVLILADDMGYSDIGCYGGEIRTPNLDRLAAGGLRFTQFYNTARCCPTRASLLTGLYPHQAGVGHMMEDKGYDGYRGDLNRRCVTIAEVLRSAGYATIMSGKWHVTRHTGPEGPKDNWPRQRGFDRFFGTITGAGSFFRPTTLTEENTRLTTYPDDFYYTDAINDHTVSSIEEHVRVRGDQPLFAYVAHTAPHWPLHALPADIERYLGTYRRGWDALRRDRRRRMIELGLIAETWPLSPRDAKAQGWTTVEETKRAEMDWRMAIYAAQIDRMDQGIGRILSALEESGRLENTLILFLADNGGCAEGGIWGFENKKDGVLGTDSSFASYGLSWANASNTPFRLYKHWVHEGGIATPLIAHWPAGISGRGELRSQPGHLIDIMATCVEVSGATYPDSFGGAAILPMEGRSLVPAFAGESIQREALYWEHEGNRAIRIDEWKLVAKGAGGLWELYDLVRDRTELNDLASAEPGRVVSMSRQWQRWAERCGVLPLNPRKRERRVDFSTESHFVMKAGDDFPRQRAPYVAGQTFFIEATIRAATPAGVIVAQGGSSDGWALYVQEDRLCFAIRHRGKLTIVKAVGKIPSGETILTARLASDGSVTLRYGDRLTTGQVPGPLAVQPADGLQVGAEFGRFRSRQPLHGCGPTEGLSRRFYTRW